MLKKLLTLSISFLLILNIYSQEKRKIISGKIIDSISTVKNANIINLKTNQGTFSNDNGLFRMFVSLGDSLKISSIQHISKTIIINKNHLKNKELLIKLVSNIYQLDEFELKRHNLSGRLGIDSKSVPKDKRDSLLNQLMDFSKINMKASVADDYIDKHVRPPINQTDPTASFAGAGASVSIAFKYSEKLWALRKDLAYKKSFPYKILSELGDKFFFDELKIPIERYFHFLEYCNPLGIEKLHKEGKLLEIITILRRESISYHKIIKNN